MLSTSQKKAFDATRFNRCVVEGKQLVCSAWWQQLCDSCIADLLRACVCCSGHWRATTCGIEVATVAVAAAAAICRCCSHHWQGAEPH
jgi:hypothetical protein